MLGFRVSASTTTPEGEEASVTCIGSLTSVPRHGSSNQNRKGLNHIQGCSQDLTARQVYGLAQAAVAEKPLACTLTGISKIMSTSPIKAFFNHSNGFIAASPANLTLPAKFPFSWSLHL